MSEMRWISLIQERVGNQIIGPRKTNPMLILCCPDIIADWVEGHDHTDFEDIWSLGGGRLDDMFVRCVARIGSRPVYGLKFCGM